jgi:hypothetical protein
MPRGDPSRKRCAIEDPGEPRDAGNAVANTPANTQWRGEGRLLMGAVILKQGWADGSGKAAPSSARQGALRWLWDSGERAGPWASMGGLELAPVRVLPDAGTAAVGIGDQRRLAQPRGDRRGGVADMDHERAAADRGAVDPFGVRTR